MATAAVFHALDQRFQVRGIPFTAYLYSHKVLISYVFIAVDRIAHLPQSTPQFVFFRTNNCLVSHR